MTYEEYLAWCKKRALKYVDRGELENAWNSMLSDLGKHPETADHPAIEIGNKLKRSGHMSTFNDMRDFIEGFR